MSIIIEIAHSLHKIASVRTIVVLGAICVVFSFVCDLPLARASNHSSEKKKKKKKKK